jgi:ATP-dependent exoDNAse (exonuclease V) beta subunit
VAPPSGSTASACGSWQPESPRLSGRARSGAVDLAFKQEGIWVIVDFKTDRDLSRTLDVYQRQVQLYAQMVAHATGEPTRSVLMRI